MPAGLVWLLCWLGSTFWCVFTCTCIETNETKFPQSPSCTSFLELSERETGCCITTASERCYHILSLLGIGIMPDIVIHLHEMVQLVVEDNRHMSVKGTRINLHCLNNLPWNVLNGRTASKNVNLHNCLKIDKKMMEGFIGSLLPKLASGVLHIRCGGSGWDEIPL